MAIGDNYITTEQVKTWMSLQGSEYDSIVDDVCAAISRDIEDYCHRQFNKEDTPSARVYVPLSPHQVLTDDFHTSTGLIVKVDQDDDGVFETTLTSGDYELRPLNGVRNGRTGYPFWEIRLRSSASARFCGSRSATVEVTAAWGWAAVPDNVFQAAKQLASDTFQSKDSRMGLAGTDQFGTVIRVRDNVLARNRLKNYVRGSVFL